MSKTLDDYFADWESWAFGFGYGTGEDHTLGALRKFFENMGRDNDLPNGYDYRKLERALGPQVTWLLINTLCHIDVIEYGTSPRGGWLTTNGVALKEYMLSKPVADLVEVTEKTEDYAPCFPDHCNCNEGPCQNPFWPERP